MRHLGYGKRTKSLKTLAEYCVINRANGRGSLSEKGCVCAFCIDENKRLRFWIKQLKCEESRTRRRQLKARVYNPQSSWRGIENVFIYTNTMDDEKLKSLQRRQHERELIQEEYRSHGTKGNAFVTATEHCRKPKVLYWIRDSGYTTNPIYQGDICIDGKFPFLK